MKKLHFLRTIAASCALSFLAGFSQLPASTEALLLDDSILEIEAHYFPSFTFSVPTVHGVTFQQEGVVTHKGWQYATFYNGEGRVSVGRRTLPGGQWETFSLDDYTFATVDSHNSVVIGIAPGDGSIHLSFDHHKHPLKYRLSVPGAANDPENTAWSADLFGPIRNELDGTALPDVTYPRFIPAPDGALLFTYRVGTSGNGDEILYEYDSATGDWTRIGAYISRAGTYSGSFTSTSTSRNAYPDNTLFDANGRLHTSWCWRESFDPRSNHDIYYAYSDDHGRTWENSAGVTVAEAGVSPMALGTTGLKVWDIPQNRNYINNSALTVDPAGRVHIVAWHFPDHVPDLTSGFDTSVATSAARFHHYWRDLDGEWRRNPTDLTGIRPKLVADSHGQLYLAYGDLENIKIATATPATGWTDWAEMTLTGALPEGRAREVNLVVDPFRWATERVLSIYAQEIEPNGFNPTPLHVLDYHVSRENAAPSPANALETVAPDTALAWTAGHGAAAHDLYFGTDREAVSSADGSSPEYLGRVPSPAFQPEALEPETPYFWRVDAVDADGNVTPGLTWWFTTTSFIPEVQSARASHAYGGTLSIEASLVSHSGAPADLSLYWGYEDGNTTAGAWANVVPLGEVSPGPVSATLAGVGEEAVFFRFFSTNESGSSWSAAPGIIAAREDLAHWNRSALLTIDWGEDLGLLTDFPVLVRIGPETTPGFSYEQFLSPLWSDLRFSSPSGDTHFAYEVEQWNSDGVSHVWVRVPAIDGPTQIRVWWGRTGRTAPDSAATWANQFSGIWHLDETVGLGHDSSLNGNHGTSTDVAPSATSIIPGAATFNGTASQIRVLNHPTLNPGQMTIEAWIRTTQSGTAAIINKDRTSGGFDRVWQFRQNNGKLEFIVFRTGGQAFNLASNATINDGEWRHVAGTWDGATVRLYVDGLLDNSAAFSGPANSAANDLLIARGENASPGYLAASLDELRLSATARSASWLRAAWLGQKPGNVTVTAGEVSAPDLDQDLLPDAWEMEIFGSTPSSDGQTQAGINGSGTPPLLAFATGVDPTSSADFPYARIESIPGESGTFTYDQISGGSGTIGIDYTASSLRYRAEFSTDLGTWHSGSEAVEWTGEKVILPQGTERVTVRYIGPGAGTSTRLFVRLAVEPAE